MSDLEPVLSDPKVIEAMVAAAIAVLTLVTGLVGLGIKKLRDLANTARAIDQQIVNNHGPEGKNDNLRVQIDRVEAVVTEGFRRMDQQFGEAHDRDVNIERRVENAEASAREEHSRIWKAVEKQTPG